MVKITPWHRFAHRAWRFEIIYQAWDAVFHHQMKQSEESVKYDAHAQRSCFDELRGVSSGDETLCEMLDITSQTR